MAGYDVGRESITSDSHAAVRSQVLWHFFEHIPLSMSMLGIVLIKYSGNVWL